MAANVVNALADGWCAWWMSRIALKAERSPTTKPAEIMTFRSWFVFCEAVTLADAVAAFLPPRHWTDWTNAIADVIFAFGLLMAMCDVRPPRRQEQRVPAHAAGAGARI
jgi:hypothetical protein